MIFRRFQLRLLLLVSLPFHIPHALRFCCKVLMFQNLLSSFLFPFPCPETAACINIQVPFHCHRLWLMAGVLLGTVLSVCTCSLHDVATCAYIKVQCSALCIVSLYVLFFSRYWVWGCNVAYHLVKLLKYCARAVCLYYYYPNFSLLSFSWEIFTYPGMYHQPD
jgi:hypothetical protein